MLKKKTHKATAKRFIIKKSKKGLKIMKRSEGQDHFNAKESGKVKRNKRSDVVISVTMKKTILNALPYSL